MSSSNMRRIAELWTAFAQRSQDQSFAYFVCSGES